MLDFVTPITFMERSCSQGGRTVGLAEPVAPSKRGFILCSACHRSAVRQVFGVNTGGCGR